MENIIRKHIEELCQAEGHEALKENYEDSKQDIAGCVKYINEEARKVIKGQLRTSSLTSTGYGLWER